MFVNIRLLQLCDYTYYTVLEKIHTVGADT